jgi:hypothetical protein
MALYPIKLYNNLILSVSICVIKKDDVSKEIERVLRRIQSNEELLLWSKKLYCYVSKLNINHE